MNKLKLTIGDWSEDGHNHYEVFVYESNKTVEEIQQAYKDSCKLTGLSFNGGEDYTGLELHWNHPEFEARKIAVKYQDSEISKLAEEILKAHGIDVWEGFDLTAFEEGENAPVDGVTHFIDLWLKFVKLSLPDLELEEASFKKSEVKDIPAINGWWNPNLNSSFGYGLYE